MRIFVIPLLSFMTMAVLGQSYNCALIPDSLLQNADAVIRVYEVRINMQSKGNYTEYQRTVITVLNEKGEGVANLAEKYNSFASIESIDGALYDKEGQKVKRIKRNEIIDQTANDGSSLIDDSRLKLHHFEYSSYPYTVEYEVEKEYRSGFFAPAWYPQPGDNISVENASFSITLPADMNLRYKMNNYRGEPSVTAENSSKKMTWSVSGMPARKMEYASPHPLELVTSVRTGAAIFEFGDYQGDMSTWDSFGTFIYELIKGRDVLPDADKLKVHQIADTIRDPYKKVEALYDYLQATTRYINVSVGIGGWQPFDASYVSTKKYGDCKALSNYMVSLLKEAGIKSYYSLIKSGEGEEYFMEDFPCSQFDHVIVCVPMQKDTVWLECTDQTLPAGFLGDFTCNRPTLLITENGGKLVRTPVYNMQNNTLVRNTKATLDENGQLIARSTTVYRGLQYDYMHSFSVKQSKDAVLEMLRKKIDLPSYDITAFEYKEERKREPSITEKLQILSSYYASITGKRMFVVPNIISRFYSRPPLLEKRNTDISINVPYIDIDSTEIVVPPGYLLESQPADNDITSKFGRYISSTRVNGQKIFYHRRLEMYRNRYPAAEYNAFAKYIERIYNADRSRLVLLKKD